MGLVFVEGERGRLVGLARPRFLGAVVVDLGALEAGRRGGVSGSVSVASMDMARGEDMVGDRVVGGTDGVRVAVDVCRCV